MTANNAARADDANGSTRRVLFIGDVVGEPGRRAVRLALPKLRHARQIDVVIANAENAAGGSGLSTRCCKQLMDAGVDAFTMGDHVYREKDIHKLFERNAPICRPANYPAIAGGPDHVIVESRGARIAVVSVLGRLFMKPVDCPFQAVDRVLATIAGQARIIIVDMHAEATSEKQLMQRYLAGRVSAVVGTHTHVPTADAAILPPGTAVISDVGMTGGYGGVIGRKFEHVLQAVKDYRPVHFEICEDDARLGAVLLECDAATGLARGIELIQAREADW